MMIHENVKWSTPMSITPKVQAVYPQVTKAGTYCMDSNEQDLVEQRQDAITFGEAAPRGAQR